MKTRTWDVSEHLDSEEAIAAYLNAAIDDGDPTLIQAALGDIAKAKGMSQIARESGMGRQSLYKSLDEDGNPSFTTIINVAKALGLKLTFATI
ncbi:addiction module antidote protein [Bifidobacterium sp.]|uniref:addiction module antidote protein n=1 Tax=Bifidobacterium sp. TaxID=41200 RepID=UPI0025C2B2D5|nr:addiction module antidote protein [Bifidobacterium sp.]MCI1634782.1 putative addiction module antidote protein [Bifidobacterium sp.]